MARYIGNPVTVDAFRILTVCEPNGDGARLLVLENGNNAIADAGMLARYTPVPGDYVVHQADGYEYLNPAAVFERKYSPILESHKPPLGPCPYEEESNAFDWEALQRLRKQPGEGAD